MKKWTRREMLPLLGAGLAGSAFVVANQTDNIPHRTFDNETQDFIQPKRLQKGDCIGICAPAGALRRKEEVAEFTQTLNQMGFRVKVGKNVYRKHGYFAGTDAERTSDFMDFIEDDEVQGIFFLRGGWGCARLLSLLDFKSIRANPKVIMGFSDATSMLNAITDRSRVITFHGPSGNSTWNNYSKKYIESVLMSGERTQFKNSSSDHSITTYSSGTASGILWGGNLSVVTSMIGSPYFPDMADALLFLEEVGEEPYRVDRMLTQLEQAGILDRCNGIILGSFRKCSAEEPDRSFTLEEVFEQHFNHLEIPVFYGAQIGHTVNKFTIPIGVEASMDADTGTVQLTHPAVR
jgi:muramoyltetrapeptide carboxypeptidase